ncbi:MAG: chemotaxis protein CheW [Acidobacteriota bacterium]
MKQYIDQSLSERWEQLVENSGLLIEQKQLIEENLPTDNLDLVCAQLDEQQFALYLPAVTEVIRMVKLTPVPGVSTATVGLLNLRRLIVPVIDLRILLELPVKPYDENTPIILIEYRGKRRGLIVDAISEVINVPANAVTEPAGLIPHSEYVLALIQGQAGLIMMLNHMRLLSFDEESGALLRKL